LVSSYSTSIDTNYHGSPFVTDWLLTFANGETNVKFNLIFPALVQGLKQEGQSEPKAVVDEIIDSLNKVRNETRTKSETKKIEQLQDCCAKLYMKNCYIYRVLNTALRDDDRTKLNSLGPFCYMVYNYTGRHLNDQISILHRLRQFFIQQNLNL
jgi:hypothetical protein